MDAARSSISPADLNWAGSAQRDMGIKRFDFQVEVIEHDGTPLDSVITISQNEYEKLASFSNSGELLFTSNGVFVNVVHGSVSMDFMVYGGALVTLAVNAGNSVEFVPESFTITSSVSNTNRVIVLIDGVRFFVHPGECTRIVEIDIMPVNESYCLKQNTHSMIPVVIFGSAFLDVRSIELSSLLLQGPAANMEGEVNNLAVVTHVNDDEYPDIVVEFDANNACQSTGFSNATLRGNLSDGTIINGMDIICIAP
jgi:hypothetical protein